MKQFFDSILKADPHRTFHLKDQERTIRQIPPLSLKMLKTFISAGDSLVTVEELIDILYDGTFHQYSPRHRECRRKSLVRQVCRTRAWIRQAYPEKDYGVRWLTYTHPIPGWRFIDEPRFK